MRFLKMQYCQSKNYWRPWTWIY